MEWTCKSEWHETIRGVNVFRRYKEGLLCVDREELFTECGLIVDVGRYEGWSEGKARREFATYKIAQLIAKRYADAI